MTEWKEFEDDGVGIRANVNGIPCYVVPWRFLGWSWHVMPLQGATVQGYAPTQEAACAMAEKAALEVE